MNTLYEIFIMGFKRYGAEIVCSALIFISIWFFPRLRNFLKRSLRDNIPKSVNNPEAETLEDIPEEDNFAEMEDVSSDKSDGLQPPEWVNERRKEFVDPVMPLLALCFIMPFIITVSIAFFFHILNDLLLFILLGLIYLFVIILAFVVNSSIKLFISEAERGNPYAQYHIGIVYKNKKAYQLSYVWYYLSGLCGHPKGYSKAAKMEKPGLLSGAKISSWEAGTAKAEALRMFDELKQKRAEAFEYYRSKAWSGDSIAQYNLGYVYQKGEGTEQNDHNAYVWYFVAQLSGDRKAESRIEKLKSKLFPSQAAEAEEEAKKKFNAIQQRKLKK